MAPAKGLAFACLVFFPDPVVRFVVVVVEQAEIAEAVLGEDPEERVQMFNAFVP